MNRTIPLRTPLRAALLWLLCLSACAGHRIAGSDRIASDHPHKIVLIAGPKSHGPEGNGQHDYAASARLLKVMLEASNVADRVLVEVVEHGWPTSPTTLSDADAVLVISDGRDGDKYTEALHLATDARVQEWNALLARKVGFLVLHFSTFAPDRHAADVLRNVGAYFDWETDGKRAWYSNIKAIEGDVVPLTSVHPILRGVATFHLRDEFYFDLRFTPGDPGLTPLLAVPALGGRQPDGNVVAWARQREDGGRSFGATFGHSYDNWKEPTFRRTMMNALVWAAGLEVPAGGVNARYPDRDEVRGALAGINGTTRARPERAIRALVLTGDDGPFHPWPAKTQVLRRSLEQDGRFLVEVTEDVEDLSRRPLKDVDVLVLNYCNWNHPDGLSKPSQDALTAYLGGGGGLAIIHFSNGAWHRSLPQAPGSDWPEYRKIAARVWDHTTSTHDPFRIFPVTVLPAAHPITQGMHGWSAPDELYFRQAGDAPIEVLVTAVPAGATEPTPMAWTSTYGKGRVFQTLLGHNARSLATGGTAELVRRGAVWAAGRLQRDVPRADVEWEQAQPAPSAPLSK